MQKLRRSMVEKRLDLAGHRRRLESLSSQPSDSSAGWIAAVFLLLAALALLAWQR